MQVARDAGARVKRAKHTGAFGAGCAACVTWAEKERMPWHASYIDVLASRVSDPLKVKHRRAVERAQRNELKGA